MRLPMMTVAPVVIELLRIFFILILLIAVNKRSRLRTEISGCGNAMGFLEFGERRLRQEAEIGGLMSGRSSPFRNDDEAARIQVYLERLYVEGVGADLEVMGEDRRRGLWRCRRAHRVGGTIRGRAGGK